MAAVGDLAQRGRGVCSAVSAAQWCERIVIMSFARTTNVAVDAGDSIPPTEATKARVVCGSEMRQDWQRARTPLDAVTVSSGTLELDLRFSRRLDHDVGGEHGDDDEVGFRPALHVCCLDLRCT